MWVWGCMRNPVRFSFVKRKKELQITCGSWVVPSALSFLSFPCPMCPSGFYIVSRVSVALLLNREIWDLKFSRYGAITSEHTISHLSVSHRQPWCSSGMEGVREKLLGIMNNPSTEICLLLWLLFSRRMHVNHFYFYVFFSSGARRCSPFLQWMIWLGCCSFELLLWS